MLYREIEQKFDTGDIVLFTGNTLLHNFLGIFMESSYNDGGIIIKNPAAYKKGLYLLKAKGYDSETKDVQVELVDFKDIYAETNDKNEMNMYWRKLYCVRDHNFYTRLYTMLSVLLEKQHNSHSLYWIVDQYNAYRQTIQPSCVWSSVCLYVFVTLALLPIYFDWAQPQQDLFKNPAPLLEGGSSLAPAVQII